MEPRPIEVVRWRVGYSALIVELFSCLLVCISMLFYLHVYPALTLSIILIVGICAVFSVHRYKRNIGVLFTLNYCTDEACFTTFERGDKSNPRDVASVVMLWRSSHCVLIRIQCLEGPSWRQWVYASETSEDCYRRLLRVLR